MVRHRTHATVLTAVVGLLAVLTGCTVVPSASVIQTAAVASGPSTFMVQISSLAPAYSPATLADWFQRACSATARDGSSGDLVLQDIARPDGTLASEHIDAILPFLPGGRQACFARVFVGTIDLMWTGAGSKYVEGIQDPTFRARNLAQSKSLASEFVSRYPDVPINWYLTYEANLNYFYYPAIAGAYQSFLTTQMQDLSALRPAARFAWSPAFWYPYSSYSANAAGMSQLTSNLRNFFSALRQTTAGIQMLDLQDFVSGSRCYAGGDQTTPADAANWARFLIGLQEIEQVAINVEQYALDCTTGTIGPGDPVEVQSREAYYLETGLTVGPGFELRYWMSTHTA